VGESSLQFRLLGTFEVAIGDRVVPIGSTKQRHLLALLVMNLNSPVSSDVLIDTLWCSRPPVSAPSTLRSLLYRLRRTLEDARAESAGVALRGRGSTYAIEANPLSVDVHRFEAFADAGRQSLRIGAVDEAAGSLVEALGLWRGPALHDLVDMDVARVEASRLDEARRSTVEALATAELLRNRPEAAVNLLEPLLSDHPLREGAWGQLMLAFYRLDRQAEALRAYQTLRHLLAEELGLEPSPALRRLEQQILAQSPQLDAATGRPDVSVVYLRPSSETVEGIGQLPVSGDSTAFGNQDGMLPTCMPLVGRRAEMERLQRRWKQASQGQGGLVLVTGEPGIGKTRLTEEIAGLVERSGGTVFWGHCFEGDWTPPYGAFAEVVEAMLASGDLEGLRADIDGPGPTLTQIVPGLRTAFPELPAVVALQPGEERFRLLDALAKLFLARSRRAPLLVCLDDLHWADQGTIHALQRVARQAPDARLLIVATYRDAEVDRDHPLVRALGSLRRETEYDVLRLAGLPPESVGHLLDALADHDVPPELSNAIADETDGNPFFIREVLRHLVEEGQLYRRPDGRWTADGPVARLGLPQSVHDVVRLRLARLSEPANRLLRAACTFEGTFRLDIVASVSNLDEREALDALDEVLLAQLLQPAGAADSYGFTHALIRQVLYADLSPSRQIRLHRQVAEALEQADSPAAALTTSGEIATQYHRSRSLPGAERGADAALMAATQAEAAGGQAEAARFLRVALDLIPCDDPRRPQLLARLGLALIWSLQAEEGLPVAVQAAEGIAATEGADSAATYLADAAWAVDPYSPRAWELARHGLRHVGAVPNPTWARLIAIDFLHREREDPRNPGIPFDTPERWEAARILRSADPDPAGWGGMEIPFASRSEVLATSRSFTVLPCWAGEFKTRLGAAESEAEQSLTRGQLIRAARCLIAVAFCRLSLGHLDESRAAIERAERLVAPLDTPLFGLLHARENLALYLDDDQGLEELAERFTKLIPTLAATQAFALGPTFAMAARVSARLGRADGALGYLERLVPWLEEAPGWSVHFPCMAGYAAETLWLLERLDHLEVVERALHEKVLAPDFRDIAVDARLALARICALRRRYDRAAGWFAEARRVLGEQGARPLLAITDFDEGRTLLRQGTAESGTAGSELILRARRQFEEMGMTGWVRRADRADRDGSDPAASAGARELEERTGRSPGPTSADTSGRPSGVR
jgi:DNA-binding SARP family transcriptional activator